MIQYEKVFEDTKSQETNYDKYDKVEIVRLPPMISNIDDCKYCFQKDICALSNLAFEADQEKQGAQGQFQGYLEIEQKIKYPIRKYFKRFVECITLEENSEKVRYAQNQKYNSIKETDFKIDSVKQLDDGVEV